jgi:hypothetical protein
MKSRAVNKIDSVCNLWDVGQLMHHIALYQKPKQPNYLKLG